MITILTVTILEDKQSFRDWLKLNYPDNPSHPRFIEKADNDDSVIVRIDKPRKGHLSTPSLFRKSIAIGTMLGYIGAWKQPTTEKKG